MPGRLVIPNWSPADLPPVLCPAAVCIAWGLYILAYPPLTSLRRKLSILVLGIPLYFAFTHSEHIAPNYEYTDTFCRLTLIWFAHMSYEVCVLEFVPDVRPGPGEMKERFRQAYKVFFDRTHDQIIEEQRKRAMEAAREKEKEKQNDDNDDDTVTDKKTDEPVKASPTKQQYNPIAHYQHGYSRWQFVGYHVLKALGMKILYTGWDVYILGFSPVSDTPRTFFDFDTPPFFGRMPSLLEMYWRTEEAFDWTVITQWMYESYHSVFAALHVALGIDAPHEWSLSLFGSITEAYSVRNYWGRYWHDYIYLSFIGHVKCVTRGWLGMKRGKLVTRLVENTLVFFFSGVMHSIVRWQEEPYSDIWSVTWLYVAQMIPIVIEGIVQYYWRQARHKMGFGPEEKWLNRAEYAVGYLWVFTWQFFSVSTYWIIREKWTEEKMEREYGANFGDEALKEVNETWFED